MPDQNPKTIRMICAVAKDRYINVYGLDDVNRVWSWDPVAARWRPYKIQPRADGARRTRDDDIPF